MTAKTTWEASNVSGPGPAAMSAPTYLEFPSCIFKTIENLIWSRQRTSEVDSHYHLLQTSQVTKKKACALVATNWEGEITRNVYSCCARQADVRRYQLWNTLWSKHSSMKDGEMHLR